MRWTGLSNRREYCPLEEGFIVKIIISMAVEDPLGCELCRHG